MCYRENPGEMGADDALRSEIREKISLRGQSRVRLPSEEPEEQCARGTEPQAAWAQLPGGCFGYYWVSTVSGTQQVLDKHQASKAGLITRWQIGWGSFLWHPRSLQFLYHILQSTHSQRDTYLLQTPATQKRSNGVNHSPWGLTVPSILQDI